MNNQVYYAPLFTTYDEAVAYARPYADATRFIYIYPVWVVNTDREYMRMYTVGIDTLHIRSVEEIIGNRPIGEVRQEIIEIQRQCSLQSEVTSILNMRYGVVMEEANYLYRATGTNVPYGYRTLHEYKMKCKTWDMELLFPAASVSTCKDECPCPPKRPWSPNKSEKYLTVERMIKEGKSNYMIAKELGIRGSELTAYLNQNPKLNELRKELKSKGKVKDLPKPPVPPIGSSNLFS